MKKKLFSFALILMTFVFILAGCKNAEYFDKEEEKILDKKVSEVLLNEAQKRLDDNMGECAGEGHKILGYNKSSNGYKVYIYALVNTYAFQNGNLVDVSGLSSPMTIYFDNDFKYLKTQHCEDGKNFKKSLYAAMPKRFANEALKIDTDESGIKADCEKYAREYLKKINRTAKVGSMIDFESQYSLLTDLGVSVKVSNKISELQKADDWYYPYWVGSCEMLIDSKRYEYTTAYDKENNQIVYTKKDFKTKEIKEQIFVDSLTGEIIK